MILKQILYDLTYTQRILIIVNNYFLFIMKRTIRLSSNPIITSVNPFDSNKKLSAKLLVLYITNRC